MTRVNIIIPDKLHKQLKLEALKTDNTLKDYITEVLKKKAGGKPK